MVTIGFQSKSVAVATVDTWLLIQAGRHLAIVPPLLLLLHHHLLLLQSLFLLRIQRLRKGRLAQPHKSTSAADPASETLSCSPLVLEIVS
jgi:hypothetical protein